MSQYSVRVCGVVDDVCPGAGTFVVTWLCSNPGTNLDCIKCVLRTSNANGELHICHPTEEDEQLFADRCASLQLPSPSS